MHLYDSYIPSGNAHKIHLLLSLLNLPYKTTSLNILPPHCETRTPSFLALNPNGKVPCLILDDGTALPESNAILYHLAANTKYWPTTLLHQSQVLQWLFWEQYSHEPYIAVLKFHTYWHSFASASKSLAEKEILKTKGQAALDVMEQHLAGRMWFVGESVSIADIALYVYTSAAEAVGFAVGENVKVWLGRVEGLEGWVKIKDDPTGLCPL
ncbi:glutathione S-transferase domain protein [Amniculicola lignicola CBS 123094]|uniref:Glutathione S-transferase domain protein n=1 Tax=Amniculicola lignicola CBS 123094 TaxID=1392246 RepID=A0A6A5WXP2_9PLEO|nr:glutathione S-transferase domain protein [Amniculicola lignicola CBS 123094]